MIRRHFGQCAQSEPALGGRDGRTCLPKKARVSIQQKHGAGGFWLISLCSSAKSVQGLKFNYCCSLIAIKTHCLWAFPARLTDPRLCCRGSNESRRPLWCLAKCHALFKHVEGEWTSQGKAHPDPGVISLDFNLTWCSVYFGPSLWTVWRRDSAEDNTRMVCSWCVWMMWEFLLLNSFCHFFFNK